MTQAIHAQDDKWLEARISKEILDTFNEKQKAAVAVAMRKASWEGHPVDIRFSLPFFSKRYFITVVSGREGRSRERVASERAARPLATVNNVVFFLGFAVFSLLLSLIAMVFFTGTLFPSLGVLPFATIYVFCFAFVMSSGLGLMIYAMEKRRKMDGSPYNFTLLKVVSVFTALFWLLSIVPYWTRK